MPASPFLTLTLTALAGRRDLGVDFKERLSSFSEHADRRERLGSEKKLKGHARSRSHFFCIIKTSGCRCMLVWRTRCWHKVPVRKGAGFSGKQTSHSLLQWARGLNSEDGNFRMIFEGPFRLYGFVYLSLPAPKPGIKQRNRHQQQAWPVKKSITRLITHVTNFLHSQHDIQVQRGESRGVVQQSMRSQDAFAQSCGYQTGGEKEHESLVESETTSQPLRVKVKQAIQKVIHVSLLPLLRPFWLWRAGPSHKVWNNKQHSFSQSRTRRRKNLSERLIERQMIMWKKRASVLFLVNICRHHSHAIPAHITRTWKHVGIISSVTHRAEQFTRWPA